MLPVLFSSLATSHVGGLHCQGNGATVNFTCDVHCRSQEQGKLQLVADCDCAQIKALLDAAGQDDDAVVDCLDCLDCLISTRAALAASTAHVHRG
ncbi:hypothetical protein ACO0LB_02505 [Undibacterium sp. SXout7W]|uniref:hypothetical protein n=1 Tax=Undibacterium sp. SXout7W TaxID=3413049 RepID=UPI003BF10361